jgi:hypothetical protein
VFAGVDHQKKSSPLQRGLNLLKSWRRLPDRGAERARDRFTDLIVARYPAEIDEAGFIRKRMG